MSNSSTGRSVKIDQDERGGWSSDRPRPGGTQRKADVATRGRALRPSDQLVYSPGSLLLIVSGSTPERDALVERVVEEKNAVFSLAKVRGLLSQKMDAEAVDAKAPELLDAAVGKRLEAGTTVIVPLEGVGPEEREHFVRLAAPHRRPCHLILVEAGPDAVSEEDCAAAREAAPGDRRRDARLRGLRHLRPPRRLRDRRAQARVVPLQAARRVDD